MSSPPPSLPALLDQRLGIASVPLSPYRDFHIFKMDLSRLLLYFAGMDEIRYVEFPRDPMSAEERYFSLAELITKFKWHFQIKIVMLPSDSSELSQLLGSLENVVVISAADLQAVSDSNNVTQPLRDLFRNQLHLNRLVGYQYQGAVTGSRFFGRESQLNALMQRPDLSYLVTGTRMSGKTSLLMEAQRRLEEAYPHGSNLPNKIYVDCKRSSTFAGLINAILTEMEERTSFSRIERWESPQRWPSFYSYLRTFVKERPEKRLHLFLDEYDRVLEMERSLNSTITWNFRALQQGNSDDKGKGTIQFVIAGSRDLATKAAQKDSGLFNFVEPCRLDNFDLGTTSLILQRPMEDLGFQIDNPTLVAQELLRESAGRPSSVQYICYNLVKRLQAIRSNTITLSDLQQVVQGPEYLQYYETTLYENTDILQQFVLSAQSKGEGQRASFSREDILGHLRKFGVHLDAAKLIHSLNDLVNSGFIVRDVGELRYVLSTPVIRRVFRQSSLSDCVDIMVKQGIVSRFVGGSPRN